MENKFDAEINARAKEIIDEAYTEVKNGTYQAKVEAFDKFREAIEQLEDFVRSSGLNLPKGLVNDEYRKPENRGIISEKELEEETAKLQFVLETAVANLNAYIDYRKYLKGVKEDKNNENLGEIDYSNFEIPSNDKLKKDPQFYSNLKQGLAKYIPNIKFFDDFQKFVAKNTEEVDKVSSELSIPVEKNGKEIGKFVFAHFINPKNRGKIDVFYLNRAQILIRSLIQDRIKYKTKLLEEYQYSIDENSTLKIIKEEIISKIKSKIEELIKPLGLTLKKYLEEKNFETEDINIESWEQLLIDAKDKMQSPSVEIIDLPGPKNK